MKKETRERYLKLLKCYQVTILESMPQVQKFNKSILNFNLVLICSQYKLLTLRHLASKVDKKILDMMQTRQSLDKAEQQQHLKGQHQQLRVEPHQRLDPQSLRCLHVAHVHLLGELRSCRSLSRLKLSQPRAALYSLSNLLDNKTIITLFLFRIFIVSPDRVKNSSTLTPSPTSITSSPTHPTRSTTAPTPSRTTRTSSSSSYPSPSPYPKLLSP